MAPSLLRPRQPVGATPGRGVAPAPPDAARRAPAPPPAPALRPLPATSSPARTDGRVASPSTAALLRGDKVAPDRRPEDRLARFQTFFLALRWLAYGLSAALAFSQTLHIDTVTAATLGVLGAWTVARTLRPVRHYGDQFAVGVHIVSDLAIACGAVMATGHWNSPFAFCLLPGIVLGGLAQGGVFPAALGLVVALITTLSWSRAHGLDGEQIRTTAQWTSQLMLVGSIGSFAYKLLADSERRATQAIDTMSRLTDANSLLAALHNVAQSLPASLDLEDVLTSTVTNLRSLLDADAVTILLRDETLPSWLVARASGVRLGGTLEESELPLPVRRAVHDGVTSLAELSAEQSRLAHEAAAATRTTSGHPSPADDGEATDDRATAAAPGVRVTGIDATAHSGLYGALSARHQCIGIVAVEFREPYRDDETARVLFERLLPPAALAIDNARFFSRIRTVAADEERIRIARDLHDRIGQSLAYIGFELDRIASSPDHDSTTQELVKLRADVRNVIGEVRETLYDIRTDVDTDAGLIPTLESFIARVAARTELQVEFSHAVTSPLPPRQEREMWQIAQEAIVNVEKHARAKNVRVRWECDATQAVIEIADDGRGFATGAGRVDSYGMRGLRERASAIGARLEIRSSLGKGTTVRCRLQR